MNLTAVKDADEVMERHVEDSLTILPPFRDCYRTCCGGASSHERLSLMDVGTGAGIPGVVLAIACPVSYVVKVRVIPKALLHHEVQFHPDVSTTMVVKPGPLLDFLCENKNVKHPNLIDWTKKLICVGLRHLDFIAAVHQGIDKFTKGSISLLGLKVIFYSPQ
ncbi:hypothetical protein S83_055435, partial [Arachis hypogaea]